MKGVKAGAPAEDLEVRAAGRRLAVRRLGSGPGPVLIFLHEGLGSIAQWRGFPRTLCAATGLPGLVYDRWGHGRSEPLALPRPFDYHRHEAEEVLPALLAACGVERPILVGHSDGGTIALLYAAAFPDRTAACITEAAHVFVEDVSLEGIRAAVRQWREGDLSRRLGRYHGDKAETVFRGWAETWLHPDFRHWSIVDRLPSVSCPLLVIQGEDDHYGTAAQVETIARESAGSATPLVVSGCGHAPHLEQAETVLRAMAAFVRLVVEH